ncbi:MAG: hypothetical protein HKO59_12595 [Phycisphaerales bacterium]|nr:hypothetical protein [Phycisphaerae bacterium]NNF44665.1 hypothetical protein [Phycisphaerales bacterium]NNM26801.1 hypothetical protein [Phycisphaerales bacterium]
MCRLLAVKSPTAVPVTNALARFAEISERSSEYQGHGWGCAWRDEDGGWRFYKKIDPVWTDDLSGFPPTTLLLAHARSAFRNEGIEIENNMPFHDDRRVFIFNGELRGVRIRAEGRIGAEKIFNYITRFDRGDPTEALRRAADIIPRRTQYVRAMNIIMSDGDRLSVATQFGEDPEYFTVHVRRPRPGRDEPLVICSDPWPGTAGWTPLANGTVREFR